MNLLVRGILLAGALLASGCAVKVPLLPLMFVEQTPLTNDASASSAVPVRSE